MNKHAAIAVILCLVMAVSVILAPTALAQPPPILRPMNLTEEKTGAGPSTVDYSVAYDTASCELIQNMIDTLIVFNGEHTDKYLGSIAIDWSNESLGSGVDSGLPISGLSFESPNQTGPNATYFWTYTFEIRPGVTFQPPYNYGLTPEDVAYSFQRTMLMDTSGGPQWMLQEPLLDNAAGDDASVGGIADLTNVTQINELGALIEHSVEYNATHVWFNLMDPFQYRPFMQILTQTWSSIESKQWIINQVIIGAGRPDWDGDWTNITRWVDFHNPASLPLDVPTPMMYGSGPFIITTLDYTNNFWFGVRNVNYFRGWPADFPALLSASPQGYVDTINVTWGVAWSTMKTDFLNGSCDIANVPTQNIPELFQSPNPPYDPPNYPLLGIRDVHPLPELTVQALFFNFNISSSSYVPIGPPGVFNETLIPSDFFGNATWGIDVRKGFAQAFDYSTFLATAYLGEASQPATAIIPGLDYYDPTVTGWSYNLVAANASLNLVGPDSNGQMLKDVGFNLTLPYEMGNVAKFTAFNLTKTALESLNPRYHVNLLGLPWSEYLLLWANRRLPMLLGGLSFGMPFIFADPHDFAVQFYRSTGMFPLWQGYSNATMDALIDSETHSNPNPQVNYTKIQQLAIADCPDFTVAQPLGRYFERDWVVDWYYNPLYSGVHFYNLWKWYYVPESLDSVPSQLHSFNLGADVNYDGKVDMRDIGTVARAFGSRAGPPIDPRWVFRGDVNNDRRIDMKDIGYVAKQWVKISPIWAPAAGALFVGRFMASYTMGGTYYATTAVDAKIPNGTTVTFRSPAAVDGTSPYTYSWYLDGVFQANGLTWTQEFPLYGVYRVTRTVTDSLGVTFSQTMWVTVT